MKRLLLLVSLLALVTVGTLAQELVTLTTPVAQPSTATCRVDYFAVDPDLDVPANSRVLIELKCNNGKTIPKVYDETTTPTGASLLTTLNRSNNAVGQTSLINKIFIRLGLDGVVVGTVSGPPQ